MPISSNRIHAMKPVARTAPRTTHGKSAKASFVISQSSEARRLRLQPEFKSIGDVAAETGLSASAIRFYEKAALVSPARAGGWRWSGQRRRASLAIVAYLRRPGFSLREAAAMLAPSANADEGWRA